MDSVLDLKTSQTEQNKQSSPTLSPQINPSDVQGSEQVLSPEELQSSRQNYQGSIQPVGFPPLPQDWVSEWQTFPSSDHQLNLYSVLHHASKWASPRALVVLHGLGEHGGRYLHLPHYLRSTVDAVYCLDHRGHGRSEGLRGHVERFDDYVNDAALAITRLDETLKKKFGKSEIYLLGHSMGGLIALRVLLLHGALPIVAASVSAAVLRIGARVPLLKKMGAIVLSRMWGSLHMSSELDASQLSHDQQVVAAYNSDRLVHRKVTPRFFTGLEEAMADTSGRNSGIKRPLQMLVPLQDPIVDPDIQLQFFRDLKLRDKALKTYPAFYHEPFNEIGKEQVFEDLAAWIKSHSPN